MELELELELELEEGHDRISQLPDEVRHQILSILPIKSVARAGVLSKSWYSLLNDLQLHLLDLDFGEEFSSGKSPEELVGSINLCLSFHGGNGVRSFRLFFYPSVDSNCDVENWIQYAVDKGVEDLELDFGYEYGPFLTRDEYMEEEVEKAKRFKLPVCLSSCNSLTRIKLSRFHFSLPSEFNGLSYLTELCLKEVNMTDEMLERLIGACPYLDILSLREVTPLSTIRISSPNLRLKFFTVADCYEVTEIELDAPHLTLFHFSGDLYDGSFKNLSSLTDAIVCSLGVDCYNLGYLRTKFLAKISHVKILTICSKTLWDTITTEEVEPEDLPVSLLHLKELQILFDGQPHYCLTGLYCFFRNCVLPLLERLFIELDPCSFGYLIEEATGERGSPPDHTLCNLRIVKINGIHYRANEILLVQFLLAMTPSLEYMVLVASESILGESLDIQVSSFHKQLMRLPKASSKAQILVYEHAEDDSFPCPTHTKAQYAPYYTENYVNALWYALGQTSKCG